MEIPFFDLYEEINQAGVVLARDSNVAVKLSPTQVTQLRQFQGSRFPYWKTRKLENRENVALSEGVWSVNHWRVQRFYGDPGLSAFPDEKNQLHLTKEVELTARQFRLHHYFRIWNSNELKKLCRPNADIRVAIKVTEDWHNPTDGAIEFNPDSVELGSHSIPILQYNPATDRFEFINSWGYEWGNQGWGSISTEVFDQQAFEAWRLVGTGISQPLKSKAGKASLRWRASYGGKLVFGFEIVDAKLDVRQAWAFATSDREYLNIEEFFVWPSYRRSGLGRKLAKLIRETAKSEKLKLRAWVSFADSEIANRENVHAAMKLLNLNLDASPHRTVGFVGVPSTKAACSPQEPHMPVRPASMRDALAPQNGTRLFRVWYATSRKLNEQLKGTRQFTKERDSSIHYGTCDVSIPRSHQFGSVGSWFWKRWIRWTDDRLRVAKIDKMDSNSFWSSIKTTLSSNAECSDQDSLVFIHGYNVSFRNAAIRAAQIGYDLRIPGITAFFSWPSKAKWYGYPADEATIDANEVAIEDFITKIAACVPNGKVHVIAHSMGNRGLMRAVNRIVQHSGVRFGQVILAAPDVDVGLFKQIAHCYRSVATRTTLYASPKDRAVGLSRLVHAEHRVGLTPPITVVDGIDTIEVPNFDLMDIWGHGYFAEAAPLLYDIFELIRNGSPPNKRLRLAECATPTHEKYWQLTH